MANLLEKILNAFELSARASSSNRVDVSDEDEESIGKKIGDLTDLVKELKTGIADIKSEQVNEKF